MPRETAKFRLAALLAILILMSTSRSEAHVSISCSDVLQELLPCAGFLQQGSSSKPSESCCSGVKDLNSKARSKQERVAVCECIKKGLPSIKKYDPKRIPLLPKACGLSITLPPIDKNIDCSKVALMIQGNVA